MLDNLLSKKTMGVVVAVETAVILIGAIYLLRDKAEDRSAINVDGSGKSFYYIFNVDERLEETDTMEKSPSPYWWVNSGGYIDMEESVGKTPQKAEPEDSRWRALYEDDNPEDTENGAYPQNVFRLVTKSKWQDFSEEAYFRILNYNSSDSPNRNISNGILLLSRYIDEDNVYYAGLRVDGNAVIKKKIDGEYYTMAEMKIEELPDYNNSSRPIVLPRNTWIGLRSEIQNVKDDGVSIRLFTDIGKTGMWKLVAHAVDNGEVFGGPAIYEEGHAGIRTDFMDVEFSDYANEEI
jgi:hypothetical protein